MIPCCGSAHRCTWLQSSAPNSLRRRGWGIRSWLHPLLFIGGYRCRTHLYGFRVGHLGSYPPSAAQYPPLYAPSATQKRTRRSTSVTGICTKCDSMHQSTPPSSLGTAVHVYFEVWSTRTSQNHMYRTSPLEGALCKEKGFRVDFEVWSTRTSQPRVTSASPRCGWVRAVRRGACHISTVTYRRHISTVAYRRGRGLDSRERDVSGSCVTLGIVYS